MTSNPPRHRHTMTLNIGANTFPDLCDELRSIADHLEVEHRPGPRSVGSSRGWQYTLHHDPTMTAERYRDEFRAWWAEARA
jgi:hypothetical protein